MARRQPFRLAEGGAIEEGVEASVSAKGRAGREKKPLSFTAGGPVGRADG